MPQLRLALAQVDPTVGDLAGNAALVGSGRRGRGGRGAPGGLPRDGAHRLPGRGPGAAASRSSTRQPGGARATLAARPGRRRPRRPRRRRRLPRRVDPDDATPTSARARPEGRARRTPPPSCTAAGSSPATPSTTCPTTASSTSSATSSPATTLTVVRVHGVDVAHRHLRGHLAGRRPGRGRPRAPAPGCCSSSTARRTSATRTTSGSSWSRAAPPRPAARSPTSTWSAGRTSWSSTATRSSSPPTARCSPGRRSSRRSCSSSTSTCRRDADARGAAGAVDGVRHVVLSERRPRLRTAARAGTVAEPRSRTEAEVYRALVLGLRDYVRKNGFRSVVLGLSGGIDSALVAAIACDAIGAEQRVRRLDAERLLLRALPGRRRGAGQADRPRLPRRARSRRWSTRSSRRSSCTGLAEENLQARVRGVILMGISNQEDHLVLATGNKSELAVGYSTIYGDAVGGFAPIKDVPKTLVWELARWRNARGGRARGETPPIPENSHHQAAVGRAAPGPDRPGLAARLRRARRVLERLRRAGDTGRAELLADGFDRRDRRPGRCRWSTAPSGSAASTRRARRCRAWRSAATGGCRSPTAGASTAARGRRAGRDRCARRDPAGRPRAGGAVMTTSTPRSPPRTAPDRPPATPPRPARLRRRGASACTTCGR